MFGGEVTRQVAGGVTVSAFGVVYPDIGIETSPVLDGEQAQDVVERRTGGRIVADATRLFVLPLDEGGYALAWRTEARTGTDVIVSFVDATSGAVLLDYSNLKTQQSTTMTARGRGVLGDDKTIGVSMIAGRMAAVDDRRAATITTLDLRGDVRRTGAIVSGEVSPTVSDVAAISAAAGIDPVVLDAQANVATASEFLLQRLGRRSMDGHDAPITAVVHPVDRQDWGRLPSPFGVHFTNAFWDGHVIVFGEGVPPGSSVDGRSRTYTSAALDIVAHEFAHAVDDHAAGLIYRNESGALSEAFADIIATAIEFWAQPAGTGPLRADYLVGEDAVGGGLRSLADPAATGHPDHFTLRDTGAGDNGGVHTNATVAGHAYHLAIEGGTNRTSGLAVEGVGRANREQVEKAFYRAFVYSAAVQRDVQPGARRDDPGRARSLWSRQCG